MLTDKVNHPAHYNRGKIEVIDFIADQELNFALGNAVKYICRAGYKGDKAEDLKKAVFYLNDEIKRTEANRDGDSQSNMAFRNVFNV